MIHNSTRITNTTSTMDDIDTDTDTDTDEEHIIHPSKKRYEDEATDKKWNYIFSVAITIRANSYHRQKILTENYRMKVRSWENIQHTRANCIQMTYIKNHYKKEMQIEYDIQAFQREVINKMFYDRNV
jgi:hypothetical protein